MRVKYSKAPISEVSFGVFFKKRELTSHGVIFDLIVELKKHYPSMTLSPSGPRLDVINDNVQSTLDYDDSGFTLYQFKKDDKYIFLQNNFISFNWARLDIEPTGNYPGYKSLFDEFTTIVNLIKTVLLKHNMNFYDSVGNYFLSYVDRMDLNEVLKEGKTIQDIVTVPAFSFEHFGTTYKANNLISTHTTHLPTLFGHLITSFNTQFIGSTTLLVVENKIDGVPIKKSEYGNWFTEAHSIHLTLFEKIFRTDVLKEWE